MLACPVWVGSGRVLRSLLDPREISFRRKKKCQSYGTPSLGPYFPRKGSLGWKASCQGHAGGFFAKARHLPMVPRMFWSIINVHDLINVFQKPLTLNLHFNSWASLWGLLLPSTLPSPPIGTDFLPALFQSTHHFNHCFYCPKLRFQGKCYKI